MDVVVTCPVGPQQRVLLATPPPYLRPELILERVLLERESTWDAPLVPLISMFLLKLPILLLMALLEERGGRSGAVWVTNGSVDGKCKGWR